MPTSNLDYSDFLIQDPDLMGGVYPQAPGGPIPVPTMPTFAPGGPKIPLGTLPPGSPIADPTSITGDFENDAAGDRNMPPLPKGAPAAPTAVTPPGMINTPPFAPDAGYESAMNKLEGLYGSYPQMKSPKWWQRLGGSVAGFGAGWSNAASRTRNPINIGAMQENILHPGYQQDLEEWQSRVTPAQAQAEIEGQKQQAWWKNQQMAAQAEYMKQHGAYWAHRAQMEQNQWKIDPKSGTIYNTITGERGAAPAPTAKDRFDIAKALGAPDDEARYYAENGNLAGYGSTLEKTPTEKIIPAGATLYDPSTGKQIHNAKEFDPTKGETKPPGPKDFTKLEVQKNTKLAQAEAAARKRIAGGEDADQVYADLTKQKQQYQNDYESEIGTLGGSVKHFEYLSGSTAPAPKSAPAPAKSAAPQPIAEGTIIHSKTDPKKRMIFRGGQWQPLP